MSSTVPVSVYKAVSEPIQQRTAVHYRSWLNEQRWTSVCNKVSSIPTLQMSDVLLEAECSLSLVAAFSVHSVKPVAGVW